MNSIKEWSAPQRPNLYAEEALIVAILDGTFPPGARLPGERSLARQLGVTRPTLREAIQRLSRDGWLTVRQGKATEVNNFWQDGGLNVLSALVQYSKQLPPDFVPHLLEVRLQLAPAYTYAAVKRAAEEILPLIEGHREVEDTPAAMASYDWQLHRHLTIASGNPIYAMILNGFADFYERLAQQYFLLDEARQHSRQYYASLTTAVAGGDADRAEQLSREVMKDSIILWQKANGRE